MAVANDKKRIMITVSREMADKIEMYSRKMGISQSQMCSQFIGQSIMAYDKSFEILDGVANSMTKK